MATSIFVNLPVQSLSRSVEFFKQLGYTFNPQFTNESGTCMVISENIYAMLLVRDFFKTFTDKEVADPSKVVGAIIALSADSRAAVDTLADKALKAGATKAKDPQDYGFMYQRSFLDLDGHHWEVFWMDPKHVQPQQ
ncbi:VOC family protein [Pyxidicoccus sp. MSG2]|uniref:VOC family protein n=1 Tax=Pyxidicoccus sp. MSG2 TaxID=2996790 RepID=UPI00226EC7D0|nr:VOC family protein [Pyxidicoccus sp. MSG2]MCY1016945.1 VOC family protein [Pyxidicoccus sp. MSG2]